MMPANPFNRAETNLMDDTGYQEEKLMARALVHWRTSYEQSEQGKRFWQWVALSGYGLAGLVTIVLLRVMEGR